MSALDDLIVRVRTAIDDVAGDKSVLSENLARSIAGNQVGSSNLTFQLNNKRIVSGSLSVKADGSTATITTSAAQLLRGQFTITSAAPATSCLASYDFQFFNDAELTEFLNRAGDFVNSATDPTTIAVGLKDALIFKASSDAAMALSARFSNLYDAGAGGKSARKGDISKKYRDLSKELFDRAVAERAAYYGTRKGQATSPAGGSFALTQRPWTPKR